MNECLGLNYLPPPFGLNTEQTRTLKQLVCRFSHTYDETDPGTRTITEVDGLELPPYHRIVYLLLEEVESGKCVIALTSVRYCGWCNSKYTETRYRHHNSHVFEGGRVFVFGMELGRDEPSVLSQLANPSLSIFLPDPDNPGRTLEIVHDSSTEKTQSSKEKLKETLKEGEGLETKPSLTTPPGLTIDSKHEMQTTENIEKTLQERAKSKDSTGKQLEDAESAPRLMRTKCSTPAEPGLFDQLIPRTAELPGFEEAPKKEALGQRKNGEPALIGKGDSRGSGKGKGRQRAPHEPAPTGKGGGSGKGKQRKNR
jgi:hypothetical protein